MENKFVDDLRYFLLMESQQETPNKICNIEGDFINVISIETVIKIFKELIVINNPDEKLD